MMGVKNMTHFLCARDVKPFKVDVEVKADFADISVINLYSICSCVISGYAYEMTFINL